MKTKTKKVSSGKEVLGEIEIPVCESLQEAVSQFGDAVCVDLINRQAETDAANRYRREKTGGGGVGVTKLGKLLSEKIKTLPADVQKEIAIATQAGDDEKVMAILLGSLTA